MKFNEVGDNAFVNLTLMCTGNSKHELSSVVTRPVTL